MNPQRDVPIEPYFLEEPPFEQDYHRIIAQDVGLPFYVDVPWPADIPGDEQECAIDLAERILRAGGTRTGFGHHEELRQSMADWAPERGGNREGDPGYWRRMVYSMSPKERNFGRLQGEPEDKLQKAKTVLAWAQDCIDDDVLRAIEQDQIDDIEQSWREAAQAKQDERELQQFRDNPPADVDGWTRFEVDTDGVELAYHAENHGTPSVAAVFETIDGELAAQEFTLEEWRDSGGNPQEARPNRYCVSNDGDGAYARLRSHLRTFDVEPLAAEQSP